MLLLLTFYVWVVTILKFFVCKNEIYLNNLFFAVSKSKIKFACVVVFASCWFLCFVHQKIFLGFGPSLIGWKDVAICLKYQVLQSEKREGKRWKKLHQKTVFVAFTKSTLSRRTWFIHVFTEEIATSAKL